MTRIVKDPEERRKEIMDKASELFFTNGYDNTSVNTIVEELKIAKGTFYYYFKSKEDVLCAILEEGVEKRAESIKGELSGISGAGNRMQFLLRKMIIPDDISHEAAAQIEDDENAKLHQMLEKKFYEKFHPVLIEIINEGIEEGVFDIAHPVEITEILLMGVMKFMHINMPKFSDPVYAREKLSSLEELFNRVFSSESGEFKLRLL